MYQEQEKRLYYISNDEVDYKRIELISVLILWSKKRKFMILYTRNF